MDPYLEAHWGDIHTSLTVYARNQLNSQLPNDGGMATAVLAVEEPVPVGEEQRTQRHLEIIDTSDGGRVVTAIEILSPANKLSADGQLAYIRKQREYLDAEINLVEIDLIRGGNFVLAVPEDRLPATCRTPYLVCTRRATTPYIAELYPLPLRQVLPNLRIPLRPTDKDVVLQLQPLLDACYRDGRYHRLNYRLQPTPRLGEADARWLDDVLRAKGLR